MSRFSPSVHQSSSLPASDTRASGEVCWAMTEGAAGMVSQVRGLAQAVGLPFELKTVNLRQPWKKLPTGMIPLWETVFSSQDWLHQGSPPRLVIACGRQALVGALLLKSRFKEDVFTVYTQAPKIRATRLDMVVAPQHDGLSGPHVVSTLGALHHVTPELLRSAAHSSAAGQLSGLRPRFAAVLLGGPNTCYEFTPQSLFPLVESLRKASLHHAVDLAILPSRRTPAPVVKMFREEFGSRHFFWDGTTENPYMAALALCSHVIVTSDSVSMVSEAAATEKPVLVYFLQERRRSQRFRRFHAEFAERGITRPFLGELDQWSYSSPNPTGQIAELIRERLGLPGVTSSRSAA